MSNEKLQMSNQIQILNAKSEGMGYEPINICGSGLLPAIIEPGKALPQSMSQSLGKKKEVL